MCGKVRRAEADRGKLLGWVAKDDPRPTCTNTQACLILPRIQPMLCFHWGLSTPLLPPLSTSGALSHPTGTDS